MSVLNHRCKDFKCQRNESQVACQNSGLEQCPSVILSIDLTLLESDHNEEADD